MNSHMLHFSDHTRSSPKTKMTVVWSPVGLGMPSQPIALSLSWCASDRDLVRSSDLRSDPTLTRRKLQRNRGHGTADGAPTVSYRWPCGARHLRLECQSQFLPGHDRPSCQPWCHVYKRHSAMASNIQGVPLQSPVVIQIDS
jgi:hypothetical protein